ncbi:MAG: hypothetical protein AVDCRST_MAG89-4805 [uncultured Gemmatimonadetes bacterium]|uniref:Uncharacterized protein n=1 Tax=uncultured Gemmatimonadota bacterium TaxID=203437 RepID=A0A6J4N3V8_9BACT|nr:MAG: hypothetical protein AVDCRST_MAG89-4805 [uncultured Gemmatimonadota bacterium]
MRRFLLALTLCAACQPDPAPTRAPERDARAALAQRLHDEGLIANPVVRDSMSAFAARSVRSGRGAAESAGSFLAWLDAWTARNPAEAARRDPSIDPRRATSPFRPPAVPDTVGRRMPARSR